MAYREKGMVSNTSKTEVMILNQPKVVEIDMGDGK